MGARQPTLKQHALAQSERQRIELIEQCGHHLLRRFVLLERAARCEPPPLRALHELTQRPRLGASHLELIGLDDELGGKRRQTNPVIRGEIRAV